LRSNILALAQLLDIEDYDSFTIEVPETDHLTLALPADGVEQIYDMAIGMPAIEGAELALEQSKLQYKVQKGAALPTISLNAGYGTYYSNNQGSAFFTQFDNNRNPSVGVGLSIPIFNNLRNRTSIKNAKLNVKNREIDLEISHQNLRKEIQQAYNDALACHEKFNAAKLNVASAQESFKYSQEKLDAGMLSGTDYTIAKTNLSKAQSECIQSKFQYIFQLKVLDYYKNIPLTL
jgi:outer membrane protein